MEESVQSTHYLHWVADEAEGGCVSRTRVIGASAVQQSIKHPSVPAALVRGPAAEERMGSVMDEETRNHLSITNWIGSFLLETQRVVSILLSLLD